MHGGYLGRRMIDWLSGFHPSVLLVAFIALGTATAFPIMSGALGRLAGQRPASGALLLTAGVLVFLLGLSSALAAASLHGYRRVAHEQVAAEVSIRKIGEQQFVLSVELPGAGEPQEYELQGEEWQIDARMLRWRAPADSGSGAAYRLHRVSAREVSHAFPRREPVDVWALLRRYDAYLPFVDAYYGSAANVPLAEGATYAVTVSQSGLAVRPYDAHRLAAPSQAMAPTTTKAPSTCSGATACPRNTQASASSAIGSKLSATVLAGGTRGSTMNSEIIAAP